MHIDDIVMTGGRTDQSNVSGNVQIHNDDLDIRSVDQTSQPNLSWGSPSLRDHGGRDTQRSSTLSERIDAELHHLSLCTMIDREERAGVESEPGDRRTFHPAIR
jgi:hypothetical protein